MSLGLTGVSLQSPKLPTGYLNSPGGDVSPGVPLVSPSGSIVQPYLGQLGGKLWVSADDAAKLSDPATLGGNLYGGVYMYVRLAAAAAALGLQRGRLLFWDTSVADDLYQVTTLESQNGGIPIWAGVQVNIPTAGNYIWMQVLGRMRVRCRAVVTAATQNIIMALAGAGADNATVDGVAAATAVVFGTAGAAIHQYLGVGEVVAANTALISMTPRVMPAWRQ